MGEHANVGALAASRSFLFAGADRERHVRKAREGPADVVIADLEDAVATAAKGDARRTLRAVLEEGPREQGLQVVRINPPDSAEGQADLAALAGLALDAVVVPKAGPESVALAAAAGFPLIPLIETAAGLHFAYDVARLPGVVRLMLGTLDLAAELALSPLPCGDELLYARGRIVADSAAAGAASPIDGVVPDVSDDRRLRAEAARSRALGFGAKACIHPRQVRIVASTFRPTRMEIAWARRVDRAYTQATADGRGATVVDGHMVDAPVVRRAQLILAEAGGD
jgi:citrate lyase beta subunit